MQTIQLTPTQVDELEKMTRPVTPAEEVALNQAYAKLEEKGFVFSGENLMILLRAYNNSPQVPITVESVLATTTQHRDSFQWFSAEEMEFRKLSDQLGTTTTDLVIRLLGRHGLVNTPGTEDMFNNFNKVVRYYLSHGWTVSADSFERAIGNLRTSLGHGTLIYRPTPAQQAAAKRWETTRHSEPPKKSALEIAKAKAAAMSHVVNPDGRRMSDVIMEEFYKSHPEESETPAETSAVSSEEAYWQRQTKDYIKHIASNLIRAEAENIYGHQHNGSWNATYHLLDHWYERRAPGRPQR